MVRVRHTLEIEKTIDNCLDYLDDRENNADKGKE